MPNLLKSIDSPADLQCLSLPELGALAEEIRQELIRTVTRTGGHLGASLGAVELTIALHRVFESPRDKLVWDVGHQAYAHKLLTGRRDRFSTIRQYQGLSGFLAREESPHDAFGAGHASTSISASLGIAAARDQQGEDYHVVAVIGDGALTGGLAFEGINNAGNLGTRLIVVLNDNAMSISPNVGALARFLNRLRSDPRYNLAKGEMENAFYRAPLGKPLLSAAKRLKNSFKQLVIFNMFWEELGFTYLGPVDGHNLEALMEVLEDAKQVARPVVVHVMTRKGNGYHAAEQDPSRLHGISPAPSGPQPSAPSYTATLAQSLIKIARKDRRVVAITAAMPDGTGLSRFAKEFPDRTFDVGIAEAHGVTFAAGLASQGMRPVVAIYSTFLQRAYDQIIHDVCIQRLPVIFALDRAGVVGDDGRTHHGAFDLSYLRPIPNLVVMSPKDENELQHMLFTAVNLDQPAAVRYPRGAGAGVPMDDEPMALPVGKAETLRPGRDLALVAIGSRVYPALEAAAALAELGVETEVVNARFAKPIDEGMVLDLARRFRHLVTVEENALLGGFGSAVMEVLESHGLEPARVRRLGLPDMFLEHAPQEVLRDQCDLTSAGMVRAIERWFPELFAVPLGAAVARS